MTAVVAAQPRMPAGPRAAVWALARIEAARMVRHPAPWLGLALSAWWALDAVTLTAWAGQNYEELTASVAPLLLGVSLASAWSSGREHTPLGEDAPLTPPQRLAARLLGGLPLVLLVTGVVAVAVVWLRWRGGLVLGDEPGRTLHAYPTFPELLQPVLLAGFAVAAGAALGFLIASRATAAIVLFVTWSLFGASWWAFNGTGSRAWTLIQVQPIGVEVGPSTADPDTFPADWLLSTPGEFQDGWHRLVVSPALAAWHDVYLVALTVLAVAIAVPRRWRRRLAIGGGLLAVVAVLMQWVVSP